MITETGRGLIFLLSQPRSGSTLLQRMLAVHPEIHTMQEPAVALYPLVGLRDAGEQDSNDERIARFFQREFLAALPAGQETYVRALRKMLVYLYNAALDTGSGRYFLDKTPRYRFIIPELLRVFPEAHYLILWRNPLAVLASVLTTWVRGEWLGLAHSWPDLLAAPACLLSGRELLGKRAVTVRYEELVTRPEAVLHTICRHLDVPFMPEMVEYGQAGLPRWRHADQKSVYRYSRPEAGHAERWIAGLTHPQVWRISDDYLHALGSETVTSMGYDFAALQETLARHRPSWPARLFTFSPAWLSRRRPAQRPWWQRRLVWFVRRFLPPPF